MKKILLLQFRSPKTSQHEVECILRAMEIEKLQMDVINVTEEDKLPQLNNLKDYSGVIFGASSDYYISNLDRQVREKLMSVKPIVDYLIENDIPTLGICFGHRLLCLLAGGKVESDENQTEGGIVKIKLNEIALKSRLFEGIDNEFLIVSGHKDSVTQLPKNAILLAQTERTINSIIQIKNNIYGIQQHPELDVDGLVWRLSLFPEYQRGRTMDEIKSEFAPMPYAKKLMENFRKIVNI